MVNKLLNEYVEKFGENFPLMIVRLNDDELAEVLNKCLDEGKPYEFDEETKKLLEDSDVIF